MHTMTKSQYAEYRKVSRAAISKHVKNGNIVFASDGKVDVELSDYMLDQCSERVVQAATNPTVGSTTNGPIDADSYAAQRTLLTKYKAELAKIDLDRQNGKLVESAPLKDSSFLAARKLRDALYSFIDRMCGPLAADTNQLSIRNTLTDEFNKLLSTLVEDLKKLLGE